jgi:lipoprotein-anchoring transpeptidase ErfK/SrfK
MPFNGGIGFHDANWQPYFGGDRFMEGGSHGCINMPPEKAAELYNIIDCNIPIVCFY